MKESFYIENNTIIVSQHEARSFLLFFLSATRIKIAMGSHFCNGSSKPSMTFSIHIIRSCSVSRPGSRFLLLSRESTEIR